MLIVIWMLTLIGDQVKLCDPTKVKSKFHFLKSTSILFFLQISQMKTFHEEFFCEWLVLKYFARIIFCDLAIFRYLARSYFCEPTNKKHLLY